MDYEKGTLSWLLKSFYAQLFIDTLQKIVGAKDLIISAELIQPLDLICSYSLLKNMDYSSLRYISTFMHQLQSLVGNFQRIHTMGKFSKMVVHLLDNVEEQTTSMGSGFITDFILIDRDVDFPSALLSQLTYEGLLDEVLGIKCGTVISLISEQNMKS
ncbi:vacuolar protein sorting-associated protein 33B-like isoform X5 [Dinothrombium tinctorium]|uniref:Vacuolar protein sorting-associated protein 33B-like isoform X5 n=1 Tax=Dinothrombium tinctorium TaxID=1965070 RepID=A0A443QFE6_9ACAR|nr:vacuolar protein sorting-associated protein 33B-like isoform X5 [Dinothrombium tinctorium]